MDSKKAQKIERLQWMVEQAEQDFAKAGLGVVEQLRDLATRIERELLEGKRDGKPESDMAAVVMHRVLWAMPNLDLDGLVRDAAQVAASRRLLTDEQAK